MSNRSQLLGDEIKYEKFLEKEGTDFVELNKMGLSKSILKNKHF